MDLKSGECLREIPFDQSEYSPGSICVDPGGEFIVAAAYGGASVLMWNRAGQFVREFAGHSSWATTVHFSADGQFVFLGDGDGAITVWDAASGQRLVTLEAHRAAVVDLRLTPDGRYALSGSFDGSTRLWELDWELAIPGAGGDHA